MAAFLHDDAGAEKADARHHIGGDLARARLPVEMQAERHERSRADRDKNIGAQARAALAILPLGADRGGEHEGERDMQGKAEKLAEIDWMKHRRRDLRIYSGFASRRRR